MKKALIIILSLSIFAAVFIGALALYDGTGVSYAPKGISSLLNRSDEFRPDHDSYRIFDGVMMGEHKVAKTKSYYSNSYYNQLSPNEKAVYDSVLNCDLSKPSAVAHLPEPVYFYSETSQPTEEEMSGVNAYISDTYQRALDALMMDGSQAFYVKMGEGGSVCRYEYRTVFKGDRYVWCIENIATDVVIKECYRNNVQRYIRATENAAKAFTPTGDTMYQRVKSIHDYVVNTGAYLDTPYADDAYGLLIDKQAVCAGFSRAFKLLCDKNNVPCALVAGVGITEKESGEHMWCLVQMEDGMWYGVDPTWDDYGGSEYFLVGGDTVASYSGLAFSESHIPSEDFTGFGYTPFIYPSLSDNAYLK